MKSMIRTPRIFSHILLYLVGIGLFTGCDSEIEMSDTVNEPNIRRVFREATYSTYLNDLEYIGTVNRVYYDEAITPNGPTLKYKRDFLNDGSSKGFLRKTNAVELAYRTDITADIKDGKLSNIKGFEKYDKEVVDAMALPTYFVNRLKSQAFKIQQKSDVKKWYDLTHALKGTFAEKEKLSGEKLKPFTKLGVPMDSVVIDKLERVEGVYCLKYNLYYKDKDPLNLMVWEQHKMKMSIEKVTNDLEGYQFHSAETDVRHEVFQNPETGLLCREREYRYTTNKITHKDSDAVKTFKSTKIIESLYDYKMGKED